MYELIRLTVILVVTLNTRLLKDSDSDCYILYKAIDYVL